MPVPSLLLALLGAASATQISVRTAACPLGDGPVRVYDRVSVDTVGGYDSDLARYSGQGQFREYAVSTCPDNLFSLYGADMGALPLDQALSDALTARLAELRPALPPPDELQTWDRYRIAAHMYQALGRDPVFLGDLLLQASWTARDRAVGIYEGLEGPEAARALLDAGARELDRELPPHQRKILLHNLARVAHRGGWGAERDRHLAAFEAVGGLTPREREVLDTFRRMANQVEPQLQDQAIAAYRAALDRGGLPQAESARVTYLLADLLRRRGQPAEARGLFDRVAVNRDSPENLRQMAVFLSADLAGRAASSGPPR